MMFKVAVLLALVACASAQVAKETTAGKTTFSVTWDTDVVYEPQEFVAGDEVTFTWTGFHDVVKVVGAGDDPCTSTAPALVDAVAPGTFTYTFMEGDSESFYFICSVGRHCSDKGQKIMFIPAMLTSTTPMASPPVLTRTSSPVTIQLPINASAVLPPGVSIPGVTVNGTAVTIGTSPTPSGTTSGKSAASMVGAGAALSLAAALLAAAALV